jgi:hypothetical protein
MHLAWRRIIVALVALVAGLGVSRGICPAAPALFGSPLVVRMSGTLQPFNEHERHALNTLTVTIADKQQWLFKVTQVDTLPDTAAGVMILNEIFPPELHIMGATHDMAVLEQPTVAGKAVTLQGFLYIADRNFYVGGVSVAAEAAKETR